MEAGSRHGDPSVAAIVVAAGRGLRAGGDLPKQYRAIAGEAVIRPSLAAFARPSGEVAASNRSFIRTMSLCSRQAAAGLDSCPRSFGGATRQASVRAGLEALAPSLARHRAGARCGAAVRVSSAHLARHCGGRSDRRGDPGADVTDTVKRVDASGRVRETLDRSAAAHRADAASVPLRRAAGCAPPRAAAGREDFTDDAALAEWAGIDVAVFPGETGNVKLTTADDFARAEAAQLAALSDVRTGSGFDVHAFGDGDHVMLGGVRIPHARGLVGHSDADAGLHALVDAILGALADGDIGKHFPPSDPQWRGAPSDRFLAFAVERVRARGGRIAHLDLTIVCEAPRIGPHRDAMRARIAEIAGIAVDRVGVKATTSEQLGFTGRGEGIAALATATVRLPWSAQCPIEEMDEVARALLDLCKSQGASCSRRRNPAPAVWLRPRSPKFPARPTWSSAVS